MLQHGLGTLSIWIFPEQRFDLNLLQQSTKDITYSMLNFPNTQIPQLNNATNNVCVAFAIVS